MAKSIYVESDDLSSVSEWFNTRPEGLCQVWVGAIKPDSQIFMDVIGTDYVLAKWMLDKIAAGELDFRLTIKTSHFPIGHVNNYAYWKQLP